jgi:predicted  nucleic acid-binding Zn-ribbon protein
MARGKYAHKKSGRDAQALADEIESLTTELAAAGERLQHVQREASARSELEATLRTCISERDAAIAPERQRVTDEIAVLTDVLAEIRTAEQAVDTAWQAFMDAFLDQYRGNKQSGLEAIPFS